MWTDEILDKKLTTPSPKLIADMKAIDGDIIILGAGGKMGPSLAILIQNAVIASGNKKRVITVSRFSDIHTLTLLSNYGIETISSDLMEEGAIDALPEVKNVIYMVGKKFGTQGQEAITWAINAWLPSRVAQKYRKSNIVVFSTGNIYPMVPIHSGGATEDVLPAPIGDYGMSSLAREKMFEFGAYKYNTPVFIYRLNYAIDLRYGVLFDIASRIIADEPINISTPCFNCIWQGDANEIAVRALLHTSAAVVKMNITGPETVSIRYAANELGKLLGKQPIFDGVESEDALLSNASKSIETFGYPSLSVRTMIKWQAEWLLEGGRSLGKPTHFEERKGIF